MAARPGQLESMLSLWESDQSLLESDHFAHRIAVQDDLERLGPLFTDEVVKPHSSRDLSNRARALSAKLESINNELFASIRRQIQNGTCPAEFASILHDLATPPRGLAYDHVDDLVSGILQFDPPAEEARALGPESVFYQPTPARHIFHLIAATGLRQDDILVDLGSGIGHVPLLASICTGASAIGIELDPTWVAIAKNCACGLNLRNVTFLAQDARDADLSTGTVFFLYTPFTGITLASVLDSLRKQASLRPIRICTFGPCTLAFSEQRWLQPTSPPATDQVTIFFPRA